jgi:hypothetical protein
MSVNTKYTDKPNDQYQRANLKGLVGYFHKRSLKSNKNYRAILSDLERETLDSFLIKMKFATYDTSYYESFQDGHYYEFYINKDTLQKIIFVHSDSIPNELKSFAYWIVAIKKKLRLVEIDSTLEFGSLKYFLPPTVPPPTMKFTPPKN